MVDVTAIILGSVFGGLFLLTFIWTLSVQIKLNALTPPPPNTLLQFLKTWSGLFPYIFLLAGPIIDAINANYMYTKASVVGILTVIITALFGSDKFASIAESVTSYIPRIWTPFSAPVPPGVSWWSQVNFGGVLVWLILGAIVFIPMMVGQLSAWAWTSSVAISSLFIITALAGNGLLGDSKYTPTLLMPGRSSTSAGITKLDVCTTPGLEQLQTRFAPIGILLTSSILTSHMFEAIDTGNNDVAITTGSLTALSFLIELGVLYTNGCLQDYKYTFAPLISLLLGAGSGATAYYTMKQIGQESFTQKSSDGGVFHPPPIAPQKTSQSKSDKKIVVGPQPDISEPVDDQDAFVCEAYKDGELITSTIVD